jgi:predicted CopG family antitoxin
MNLLQQGKTRKENYTEYKSVGVRIDTYKRLVETGKFNQSFSELIDELIDFKKENNKK